MFCDSHLSETEPDTWWCVIFCTNSSMFGVRLWAEENLRTESRCLSVRRLLCDVLFNFIKEKSCSHKYVLPNIESVWAAWIRSRGIVLGMKRANSAAPTLLYIFPSVCHCTGAQSTPFGGLVVRFPRQLQRDWRAVQTCSFRLQSQQIGVKSWRQVCWVYQQTVHSGPQG